MLGGEEGVGTEKLTNCREHTKLSQFQCESFSPVTQKQKCIRPEYKHDGKTSVKLVVLVTGRLSSLLVLTSSFLKTITLPSCSISLSCYQRWRKYSFIILKLTWLIDHTARIQANWMTHYSFDSLFKDTLLMVPKLKKKLASLQVKITKL